MNLANELTSTSPGKHTLAHPHTNSPSNFAEPPGAGVVCIMCWGRGCATANPGQEETWVALVCVPQGWQ